MLTELVIISLQFNARDYSLTFTMDSFVDKAKKFAGDQLEQLREQRWS